MKHLMQGLLIASMLMSQTAALACSIDGKEGFVPENNLRIPVNAKRTSGITEEQFNAEINKFEAVYAPIIAQEGGNLKINRNWTDGTVNAYAQQSGSTWIVSMFGGLARHETITTDGFALVVCHELGHHIGGAPRKYGGSYWASNEGQADYFATLKCLRRVWVHEDNDAVIQNMDVPGKLAASCGRQWLWNQDVAICIRAGMAGMSVAKLFQALRKQEVAPKFETPDAKVVTTTSDSHPATQCRLDTYFQGALCEVDYEENVDRDAEVPGTCHGSLGHKTGLRPNCWFKPSVK